MHLVVITSVVNPSPLSQNVFTPKQRFEQLLDSVRSVRAKIPDAFIVIVEGSRYTNEQYLALEQAGANHVFFTHPHDKLRGESLSLYAFFKSDTFEKIRTTSQLLSINKLSGRYRLLDDFRFHYDGEMCVCKIIQPQDSYSGQAMLLTRFYSLPAKYLDDYIEGLRKCCEYIHINMEHSFYLHRALPIDKINPNQKINVGGCIAPNGEWVED